MAGNQTDFRKMAENAYNAAVNRGADKKTLIALFNVYERTLADENSACGTHYRPRKRH